MLTQALFAGLAATFFIISPSTAQAQTKPQLGNSLAQISFDGTGSGRVDGSPWSSSELKGKVSTIFYVDPDEKGLNPDMEKALKAEEFPDGAYQSIAIINLAATWLPNAAINSSLRSKQKEFPKTIYVRDENKALVKTWGFDDDAYAVASFDKEGKLNFYKAGKLSAEDIAALIKAIRASF